MSEKINVMLYKTLLAFLDIEWKANI